MTKLRYVTAVLLASASISACSDPTSAPAVDASTDASALFPDVAAADGVSPADAGPDLVANDTESTDDVAPDALVDTTSTTDADTSDAEPDVVGVDVEVPDAIVLDTAPPDDVEDGAPTPTDYFYPIRTPEHPRGVTVGITFDKPMDVASLTMNTADSSCSGNLQLSYDNFSTCVTMLGTATPHPTEPNRYTLLSAALPPSLAPLSLRIMPDVKSAAGVPMGWESTSPAIAGPYHHTIVLDGVNDFATDETLPTSTTGHTGYLAWDADYVYLGFDSPDLAANNNQTWFTAYLGAPGVDGSPVGVLYNTQEPVLPFEAAVHLQWRASDDYGATLTSTGGAWAPMNVGIAAGSSDLAFSGSFLELRVPLSLIGEPTSLNVIMSMLREQDFNEAIWAMVPATTANDGYDPDFSTWLSASLFYRNVTVAE